MLAAAGAVIAARRGRRLATRLGYLLALAIFLAWAGEYVADGVNGTYSTEYTLPLQLTDAVSAVAIVALLTRAQLAVELTYFWSLSATLQALLTPDLGQNFPSIYYFTYFGYHVAALVAALMLTFGLRIYPRPWAALKAFGATLVWAAVAGLADVITGGNYMYLHYKPVHNSLLNVLGPWPWYIASTAALALAMLLVIQLIADTARRLDVSRTPAVWHRRAGSPAAPPAPSARTAVSRKKESG